MTTQLELVKNKTAVEMAEFVYSLIDNPSCEACPARGEFCKKRPKSPCQEILEDFFNSKVKRQYTLKKR